jgi:hypothetical protein
VLGAAQVELAVRRRLDNEVGPDQIVAVLDAQGASVLQVTRKVPLIKETAISLNKVRACTGILHCPLGTSFQPLFHALWTLAATQPPIKSQVITPSLE